MSKAAPPRPTSTPGPVEVFTWPPRPAPEEPSDSDGPGPTESVAPPPKPARLQRDWRATLHAIEETWLGVSARDWRGVAREAGWVPDAPGAYCPRCGTTVGPFEADGAGCSTCRDLRLPWDRAVRLGAYEGVLRAAVLRAKYTAWRAACQQLGQTLGSSVVACLEGVPGREIVVCPVGTSTRRRLSRGIDHTLVLAREVSRATGGSLVRALARRHAPPQQGLGPEARRRNVAGSFRARGSCCKRLSGKTVVLVDDVRTTGATLRAAARELRRGAERAGGRPALVVAAVVGVTPRRRG